MNINIVYATYSGTTTLAVEKLVSLLENKNNNVTVEYIENFKPKKNQSDSLIIFATPSWLEENKDAQPHTHFISFINNNESSDFSNMNMAFMGLGDSDYPRFCGGIDIVANFFISKGAKKIGNTLKLNKYQFYPQQGDLQIASWIDKLAI